MRSAEKRCGSGTNLPLKKKDSETLPSTPRPLTSALEGRAMLAARSSGGGVGGGHPPHHLHRKHSVASLGGAKAHRGQEAKRGSATGRPGAPHRHKAALIREIETSWYLKMFGMGKEDTVAHNTGMPYR